MSKKSFSLQIGSLLFEKKALSYMLFGFFLLGILAGLTSIIHIDNPDISTVVTFPLLCSMIIPVIILIKGVRKAKDVS